MGIVCLGEWKSEWNAKERRCSAVTTQTLEKEANQDHLTPNSTKSHSNFGIYLHNFEKNDNFQNFDQLSVGFNSLRTPPQKKH